MPGSTTTASARGRRLARRVRHRARRRAHGAARRGTLLTVRALAALRRPHRRVRLPGERPRVRILLRHAYGQGGTIRTVLAVSGYLARDHDVEIVSLLRERERPFFTVPPGVTVRVADDRTVPHGRVARLLARLPSVLAPGSGRDARETLYTDLRLARMLAGPQPDVLMGTRPALNLIVAETAPRGVAAVGQDHMNLGVYDETLRNGIRRSYPRLAALTVLTEASMADFAAEVPGLPVVRIPNAAVTPGGPPSRRQEKVVLAAGRLTRQKGFDLLLKAWRQVAAAHPDWTLRIFGSGRQYTKIDNMIADLGLSGSVVRKGRTADLPGEMERASVYVLSSRHEGMPMVILEAMSKGLPVVSFACPTGPAEMITDGVDGLLAPPRDVDALAAALDRVITDGALRDRLGERARTSVRAYDMDRVGPMWARLVQDLTHGRVPETSRLERTADQQAQAEPERGSGQTGGHASGGVEQRPSPQPVLQEPEGLVPERGVGGERAAEPGTGERAELLTGGQTGQKPE